MPQVYDQGGDYAVATLLATQWGLAALTRLGDESDEKTSTLRGDCLAGGYTASVILYNRPETSTYHISPGDLDEAITALLVFRGEGDVERQGAGWARVKAFREGVIDGRRPAWTTRRSNAFYAGTRHGGQRRLADPRGDSPTHVGRAGHRDAAVEQRVRPADVAAPDAGERAQAGFDGARHLVAGSKSQTSASPSATTSHHRDAFGATPSRWNASVVRDRGHSVDRDGAADVPHQQMRVEVLLAEFADPAHAPGAKRVDHIGELLSALGQRVRRAAVDFGAFDDTGAGQRLQPLGQQRGRHLRHAAPQIVEVPAAQQ